MKTNELGAGQVKQMADERPLSPEPEGHPKPFAKLAVITIVLLAIYFGPIVLGFRYATLPLAYWDVSVRKLQVGMHFVGGHPAPIFGGKVIYCGFFTLTKLDPPKH